MLAILALLNPHDFSLYHEAISPDPVGENLQCIFALDARSEAYPMSVSDNCLFISPKYCDEVAFQLIHYYNYSLECFKSFASEVLCFYSFALHLSLDSSNVSTVVFHSYAAHFYAGFDKKSQNLSSRFFPVLCRFNDKILFFSVNLLYSYLKKLVIFSCFFGAFAGALVDFSSTI